MAKSIQQQIDAGVREALARLGFNVSPAVPDGPDPNFIAHGSPEHAQFIGLKVVEDSDDPTGFVTYASNDTTYRLEDELGVLAHYPGVDPEKAALMVLRQKVSELEAGEPKAPANAPSLWQPVDQYTVLVGGGQ